MRRKGRRKEKNKRLRKTSAIKEKLWKPYKHVELSKDEHYGRKEVSLFFLL
jgi:hypothetical protein